MPGAIEELLRHGSPVQFTHRDRAGRRATGRQDDSRGQFVFLFLRQRPTATPNISPTRPPGHDARPCISTWLSGWGITFVSERRWPAWKSQIAFETMLRRLPGIRISRPTSLFIATISTCAVCYPSR